MTERDHSPIRDAKPAGQPGRQRVITSTELFGAETEIVLLHNGMPYRLRITRQDKLILTK